MTNDPGPHAREGREVSHSPGPWKWNDDMKSAGQEFRLLDANDNPVFWYIDKGPGQAHSIGTGNFSNLDLIEAAPEMLAMLRLLLRSRADFERNQDAAEALLARFPKEGV